MDNTKESEAVSLTEAGRILGVSYSTIHRYVVDGALSRDLLDTFGHPDVRK